jgi:putative ABC transport system permease protein
MTPAADFKAAFRNVRRGGWLSVTIVLILAVAIGAVTAIFSIAHAVLIRPLPVRSRWSRCRCWISARGSPARRASL